MVAPPDARRPDPEPLVLYEVSPGESLSDAVLRAAGEVIADFTSVRPLSSIVDVESIDALFEHRRDSDTDTDARVVSFVAWDLWFFVTGEAVEVYEADTPLE